MLDPFLAWWGRQLRALVPAGMAGGLAGGPWLIASLDGTGALGLALRRRGIERSLGPAPAGPALREAVRRAGCAPLLLRLPPGLLLEREVVLPLSAERDAAAALRFEIDRITPFAAEEVHWSWETVRRDPARGRLVLRLLLVPRGLLADILGRLREAGARPALLEAEGPEGGRRRIALAGTGLAPWQRRTLRLATLACAALACATLAAPFLRQSRAAAEVEARIAALQPQAAAADALRQRLDEMAAGGDLARLAHSDFGDALGLLAAVTAVLPDDTFLTDLALKERQVTLRGQSADAARLIAALSVNPVFRNPSFAAPVTRAAEGGPDVFAIQAEAVP